MENYMNTCAICGKPIIGYWYALGKNNICQSCGASVTVYDLYMRDFVDIKPDVVESTATLVTKEELEELDSKHVINAEYGKTAGTVHDESRSDATMTDEQVEKFFTSQEPVFTTERT